MAAGKPVVTTPYIDVTNGKLMVAFARRADGSSGVNEVLSGNVSLETISANVNSIQPSPHSFGVLLNGKGNVIAYTDAKLIGKPVTESSPDLSIGALTSAREPLRVKIGGVSKPLKAMSIAGTEWQAVVALDAAEASAGIHSKLMNALVSLVVIVLVAAGVMGTVTTVSLERLSTVRDAMSAIGSGSSDLAQRLPDIGQDEVAQISRASC